MLFGIRIKGGLPLPLILFFIILFVSQPINADEIDMNSVGRVDLEELTTSHPLSRRISRLEERIEYYSSQYLQEERLSDLDDEILGRVEEFSEQSYERSEFIIKNYNKQIKRREEIAETEKENLKQELEKEKSNKLVTEIENKEEKMNQAIREEEAYKTNELKNDKQEVIRDYNREISRLKLAIRFSDLSDMQQEQKIERLAELKEAKSSEIKNLELEYEENLAEFRREKKAEIEEQKKDYEAELEQKYEQEYEKKVEEIIVAKNTEIDLLKEELEEKLAEEPIEIEAEIDQEIFADEIKNKIKAKNSQSLKRLETLEEKVADLEEEKEREISQLIEKYKDKYDLDLVISGQLPRVSAQDLTAEIKSEWSVASE